MLHFFDKQQVLLYPLGYSFYITIKKSGGREMYALGTIIANKAKDAGFMCGSVAMVAADGYWLDLHGGAKGFISRADVILLEDLIAADPLLTIIVNRELWEEKRIFSGGMLSPGYQGGDQLVFIFARGCGFIKRESAGFVGSYPRRLPRGSQIPKIRLN